MQGDSLRFGKTLLLGLICISVMILAQDKTLQYLSFAAILAALVR